jgi:hypothetical protein
MSLAASPRGSGGGMTEERDSGSSHSSGDADKPRENCRFCGGSESEMWHVEGVERPSLVCNSCHDLKRAPSKSAIPKPASSED